jgi:hypothetical protein
MLKHQNVPAAKGVVVGGHNTLESSKDHGGAEHLTLACRELVIQELPDYYWGLLSGANR